MENLRVLDLFSGMGGFSLGFVRNGFSVEGVDHSERVGITYRYLTGARFTLADLNDVQIEGDYDVVIGGPPCRPWSSVNLSRRGDAHRDYGLVKKFVDHVRDIKPKIFVLENVPPLGGDDTFLAYMGSLREFGYEIERQMIRYSDYGAATRRRRMFIIGVKGRSASGLISSLSGMRSNPSDVRSVIWNFRKLEKGGKRDHVWPVLKTVERYAEYYRTGQFGWAILKWNEPAPSFGNVMKTYILHPSSNLSQHRYRPVSVLEVARIMGFNHGFEFPEEMGMTERYQMLVDSVSPVFSTKLAEVVKEQISEM